MNLQSSCSAFKVAGITVHSHAWLNLSALPPILSSIPSSKNHSWHFFFLISIILSPCQISFKSHLFPPYSLPLIYSWAVIISYMNYGRIPLLTALLVFGLASLFSNLIFSKENLVVLVSCSKLLFLKIKAKIHTGTCITVAKSITPAYPTFLASPNSLSLSCSLTIL